MRAHLNSHPFLLFALFTISVSDIFQILCLNMSYSLYPTDIHPTAKLHSGNVSIDSRVDITTHLVAKGASLL